MVSSLNVNVFKPNTGQKKKFEIDLVLDAKGQAMRRAPLACAIQSHSRREWGDLQKGWAPLLNPCPLGSRQGLAGGVGWLVNPLHRRKVKRTISERADGEGPHIMWLTAQLADKVQLDMASIYIPPEGTTHDGKNKEQVRALVCRALRAKAERGEAMAVMGTSTATLQRGGRRQRRGRHSCRA